MRIWNVFLIQAPLTQTWLCSAYFWLLHRSNLSGTPCWWQWADLRVLDVHPVWGQRFFRIRFSWQSLVPFPKLIYSVRQYFFVLLITIVNKSMNKCNKNLHPESSWWGSRVTNSYEKWSPARVTFGGQLLGLPHGPGPSSQCFAFLSFSKIISNHFHFTFGILYI